MKSSPKVIPNKAYQLIRLLISELEIYEKNKNIEIHDPCNNYYNTKEKRKFRYIDGDVIEDGRLIKQDAFYGIWHYRHEERQLKNKLRSMSGHGVVASGFVYGEVRDGLEEFYKFDSYKVLYEDILRNQYKYPELGYKREITRYPTNCFGNLVPTEKELQDRGQFKKDMLRLADDLEKLDL